MPRRRALTIAEPDDVLRRRESEAEQRASIALWLLELQTSLPDRADTQTSVGILQRSLTELLKVDRVTVAVNLHAFEAKTGAATHSISIREIAEGGSAEGSSLSVTGIERDAPRAAQIIREIAEQGHNLDSYSEPHSEEFVLDDGTYLGAIILWNSIAHGEISQGSKRLLTSMRRVLVRVLIDCAARHEALRPTNRQFYTALQQLVVEYNLTPSEERVVTMQLLGQSYKEIASKLKTDIRNVGKHLSSVHRKTGANGMAELSALMFAPRTSHR